MELASCLSTGDWNFVVPQYRTCFMSVNWRLEFCGSAAWNLDRVSQQLATGILWVRRMELASCLSTGDWNFVGPQNGTCFMSLNRRLEFCGSAVWNLDHVSQLATEILWSPPQWRNIPPVDQVLIIIVASRSHSGTPHSVGLLWTSDQPHTEASTWQHTTLTKQTSILVAWCEPAVPAS